MDPFYLYLGGTFVVFVGIVVALDRARLRKLRRWSTTGIDADTLCAACGSAEIAHPMPDVYVCGACGHEGGEGLPALERERWRSAVAAMPPAERARRGAADAEEGARRLVAAHGPLGVAAEALAAMRRTLNGEQRAAYLAQATQANAEAMGELFQAHKLLADAAWLLHEQELAIPLPDTLGIAPLHDHALFVALHQSLHAVAVRLHAGA